MDYPGIFSAFRPLGAEPYAIAGAVAVLAIVVLLVIFRRIRRRGRPVAAQETALRIDLAKLNTAPPPEGSSLTIYNVPVRLAAIVMAPVGRGHDLPDADELPETVEQIVPGLMRVLSAHQPVFRRWPPQLSAHGFNNAFFAALALPGDRGKGTPWVAVAGRVDAGDRQLLVGLVMHGASAGSLSTLTVEKAHQWLDLLKVHGPPR